MFSRLRTWLFGSEAELALKSLLYQWSEHQRNNFADFKGDPVAAVSADLASAGASSESLPVLICADSNKAIRILAMVKAGLERQLECEDSLIAALLDESESVRRMAARVLVELGTVRGLAAVVAGNKHGHGIRTSAAQRLKEHGTNAEPAIPALLTLLYEHRTNWRSNMWAAFALVEIGPKALPYLIHAIRHGSSRGMSWAAFALIHRGDYTDIPEDVVELLKQYQEDEQQGT